MSLVPDLDLHFDPAQVFKTSVYPDPPRIQNLDADPHELNADP